MKTFVSSKRDFSLFKRVFSCPFLLMLRNVNCEIWNVKCFGVGHRWGNFETTQKWRMENNPSNEIHDGISFLHISNTTSRIRLQMLLSSFSLQIRRTEAFFPSKFGKYLFPFSPHYWIRPKWIGLFSFRTETDFLFSWVHSLVLPPSSSVWKMDESRRYSCFYSFFMIPENVSKWFERHNGSAIE